VTPCEARVEKQEEEKKADEPDKVATEGEKLLKADKAQIMVGL